MDVVIVETSKEFEQKYVARQRLGNLQIKTVNALCVEDYESAAKFRDRYIAAGGDVENLRNAELVYIRI